MIKITGFSIRTSLTVLIAASALSAAAAGPREYFGGNSGKNLQDLVSELRSAGTPFPEPLPALPERRLAPARETSRLTGFITRFQGEFHVGSNLYFEAGGDPYRIEDFSGRQKFSLKGRDLYLTLKDSGEFRLGPVNPDPGSIKEGARVSFELVPDIGASIVFLNRKLPGVSYEFTAGITGFGFVRVVTERTERMIQLTAPDGGRFCYYTNIRGRDNFLLYRGACRK